MTVGNYVNFICTTLKKYNELDIKDADSLYFIEDANKIFKGNIDMTSAITIVESFDTLLLGNLLEGRLYLNPNTHECRLKQDNKWIIINPGYINSISELDDNEDRLITGKVAKDYVDKTLSNIHINIDNKADKSTTLDGYGIKDGISENDLLILNGGNSIKNNSN